MAHAEDAEAEDEIGQLHQAFYDMAKKIDNAGRRRSVSRSFRVDAGPLD